MSDIGTRIRQRRNELGLNGPQLAKLCAVTKATVSQWENGDSVPTGPNLARLAQALKTTEKWIAFGRGPKEPKPGHNLGAVPLINFVQAGEWAEATEPYPPGIGERYLAPTHDVGTRAFALTIQGRSMEPEFHEGDDIIVDPDVQPRNGDFVVAKRTRDNEATFKRLYRRETVVELRPLNPAGYEILQLDRANPGRIIGVMVEHRRYRR